MTCTADEKLRIVEAHLEEISERIRRSEPVHPSDDELGILERFGAEYFIGNRLITAREYWRNYIVDNVGFEAECNGLTREEYIEWMASGHRPLCGARTKGGWLCQNANADAPLTLGVEQWKEEHRAGYCRIHGGGL